MGSVVPAACHKSGQGLLSTGHESPGRLAGGILTKWPHQSSGSRMSELLTLSLLLSPATLWRKLISAAFIHDPPGCTLLNTTQRAEEFHYF